MNKAMLLKPVIWIGPSKKDLLDLPKEVQHEIGFALFRAQQGLKHLSAKPLKGFKGAGVLEVVEDYSGDTFRAVYTVRFSKAVYVLHVFQKKSKHGIATPKRELDVIEQRLKIAEDHHVRWSKEGK